MCLLSSGYFVYHTMMIEIKINGSNYSNDFIDQMYEQSYLHTITKPTRITNNYAILIDNIFTCSHNTIVAGILLCDICDNNMIFSIDEASVWNKPRTIKKNRYVAQKYGDFLPN